MNIFFRLCFYFRCEIDSESEFTPKDKLTFTSGGETEKFDQNAHIKTEYLYEGEIVAE